MQVTLIDSMGTDLTVVNSARVSFDTESDWLYRCNADCGEHGHLPDSSCPYCEIADLGATDAKLIQYLASHNHTSPFRHCFATFRVKAPIFVARQLVKHQVGMSWNEVSRRYVDSEPEFYMPNTWRLKATDKKQGSSELTLVGIDRDDAHEGVSDFMDTAKHVYNRLLEMNVAPELARMILPQNMYTEWYWSGSLQAWAHVCNLRCKPDAQEETRQIALQLDEACAKLWPVSWKALRSNL